MTGAGAQVDEFRETVEAEIAYDLGSLSAIGWRNQAAVSSGG